MAESARQVLLDAREPGSGKPLEKALIPCGLAFWWASLRSTHPTVNSETDFFFSTKVIVDVSDKSPKW